MPPRSGSKEHLPVAMSNLKKLSDAGIVIAMGTDSGGGTGRFQGSASNISELEYEVKAGLTPMQALISATSGAARAGKHQPASRHARKRKVGEFRSIDGQPARRHKEYARHRFRLVRRRAGSRKK